MTVNRHGLCVFLRWLRPPAQRTVPEHGFAGSGGILQPLGDISALNWCSFGRRRRRW